MYDIYGGIYPDGSAGDRYNEIVENPFIKTADEPVSTFSIDADGASYANIRRFVMNENNMPPTDAIRTEEIINYFNLDYPFDSKNDPIALNGEIATCPWQTEHKLIRIGIKGKPLPGDLPPSNFVFLIDVSGSMSSEDKLELLKGGFQSFVDHLTLKDRVAIVTYAGSAGIVLPSTPGNEKTTIKNAIAKLGSGGSTAGAEGIITAYEIAEANFIKGGNNRVILGSDGDFNVGPSSQEELVSLIEKKRESGVYLTVLGVGRGNLNDSMMEQVANHGNSTFEYIDNIRQLQKVFVHEASKFYTVAKDVKVQVVFNPGQVKEYRLIGYENRLLENEDFEDDAKDAGEIGANQSITALYEIIPATGSPALRVSPAFTIDFRYKLPDQDTSLPMTLEVFDNDKSFAQASSFMKFTAATAAFGLVLRDSEYKGSATYGNVVDWVKASELDDQHGFISEFKSVVDKASKL